MCPHVHSYLSSLNRLHTICLPAITRGVHDFTVGWTAKLKCINSEVVGLVKSLYVIIIMTVSIMSL